jgi:hypothetical protein
LDRQELLTVYRYRYWDEERGEHVSSDREATLECIRSGLGIPIIDSGRQVRVGDLDAVGRAVPSADYPSDPAAGMGSGASGRGDAD